MVSSSFPNVSMGLSKRQVRQLLSNLQADTQDPLLALNSCLLCDTYHPQNDKNPAKYDFSGVMCHTAAQAG